MTLHVEHMGKRVAKKPCPECPFRRKSMRGYLGGYTADDYYQAAQRENNTPCHTSPGFKTKDASKMRPCAGMAIFRNNVCKTPRTGQAREATEAHDQDTINVLGWDFMAHHTIEEYTPGCYEG